MTKKIKTKSDLMTALDQLYQIKRGEMREIKEALDESKMNCPMWLQKSSILLSYGHLEGFIKEASDYIVSYIMFSKHKTEQFIIPMQIKLLASEISRLHECKKIPKKMEYLKIVKEKSESRAKLDVVSFINTESNLTWEIFEEICIILAIDIKRFDGKNLFFDKTLLKTRNAIAHKGKVDDDDIIDITGTLSYVENCSQIISHFKEEAEKSINKNLYLKNKNVAISSVHEVLQVG